MTQPVSRPGDIGMPDEIWEHVLEFVADGDDDHDGAKNIENIARSCPRLYRLTRNLKYRDVKVSFSGISNANVGCGTNIKLLIRTLLRDESLRPMIRSLDMGVEPAVNWDYGAADRDCFSGFELRLMSDFIHNIQSCENWPEIDEPNINDSVSRGNLISRVQSGMLLDALLEMLLMLAPNVESLTMRKYQQAFWFQPNDVTEELPPREALLNKNWPSQEHTTRLFITAHSTQVLNNKHHMQNQYQRMGEWLSLSCSVLQKLTKVEIVDPHAYYQLLNSLVFILLTPELRELTVMVKEDWCENYLMDERNSKKIAYRAGVERVEGTRICSNVTHLHFPQSYCRTSDLAKLVKMTHQLRSFKYEHCINGATSTQAALMDPIPLLNSLKDVAKDTLEELSITAYFDLEGLQGHRGGHFIDRKFADGMIISSYSAFQRLHILEIRIEMILCWRPSMDNLFLIGQHLDGFQRLTIPGLMHEEELARPFTEQLPQSLKVLKVYWDDFHPRYVQLYDQLDDVALAKYDPRFCSLEAIHLGGDLLESHLTEPKPRRSTWFLSNLKRTCKKEEITITTSDTLLYFGNIDYDTPLTTYIPRHTRNLRIKLSSEWEDYDPNFDVELFDDLADFISDIPGNDYHRLARLTLSGKVTGSDYIASAELANLLLTCIRKGVELHMPQMRKEIIHPQTPRPYVRVPKAERRARANAVADAKRQEEEARLGDEELQAQTARMATLDLDQDGDTAMGDASDAESDLSSVDFDFDAMKDWSLVKPGETAVYHEKGKKPKRYTKVATGGGFVDREMEVIGPAGKMVLRSRKKIARSRFVGEANDDENEDPDLYAV